MISLLILKVLKYIKLPKILKLFKKDIDIEKELEYA
jgi:hypothetical protein